MTFGPVFQPVFKQVFSRVLGGIVYLLRDEFTTPEAAPLTSPRTCEPGPGTLTIVDTNNVFSISSGSQLVFSGSPVVNSRLYATFARAAGRCFKFSIPSGSAFGNGNQMFGWTSGANNFAFAPALTTINYVRVPGGSLIDLGLSLSPPYTAYVIMAGATAGQFIVVGSKLIMVDALTFTPSNLGFGFSTNALNFASDNWKVTDLVSGGWNSQYGIATNYAASVSAGQETTMEADGWVEATWTAATGITYELDVRRTDDDNRWVIRCDQAASTIKLIQRQGSVETERSSAAQVWTNGTNYRIVVMCDTQTIRTYVVTIAGIWSAKNTYTSAAFNQTATGVKTSHAVTNLVTWPRVLSGAALAALQAV